MDIDIQMYALRNSIPALGLQTTLQYVRKSGFDGIEPICDDYGIGYENVGDLMRKNGLTAHSMHVAPEIVLQKDELAKLQDAFGFTTAVIPWVSEENFFNNDYMQELLSVAARNANALGLTLAYHNHAHELAQEGVLAGLNERFPTVYLQPDVFWLKAAGQAPMDFLRENARKIACIHMKEMGADKDAPAPVTGRGTTGAAEIVRFAKEQNHSHIILEYEQPDCDEIEYIARSCAFIKEAIQ
ncbi:MAG: hypothetical protein K2L51_02840, partial [Clostridiales bacterium]|nr:hypothetical protein [Clostridiales bacterium]